MAAASWTEISEGFLPPENTNLWLSNDEGLFWGFRKGTDYYMHRNGWVLITPTPVRFVQLPVDPE